MRLSALRAEAVPVVEKLHSFKKPLCIDAALIEIDDLADELSKLLLGEAEQSGEARIQASGSSQCRIRK